MTPLSPIRLIAAANAFIGLGHEGGVYRGRMVDVQPGESGPDLGEARCVAFVHYLGYWSHYDRRSNSSAWPLPGTRSCAQLAEVALRRGILHTDPVAGDLFLLWSAPLKRFAHTGVVVSIESRSRTLTGVTRIVCGTVEGNTNGDVAGDGGLAFRKSRRIVPTSGDRFVRWSDLDRPSGGYQASGVSPYREETPKESAA